MTPTTSAPPLAALVLALAAPMAAAQQAPAPKPAPSATIWAKSDGTSKPKPSAASARLQHTWDQTTAMTRREWNAAKRKWAAEKASWRDCNRQADIERRIAPKRWSFIVGCMTGS